MPHKLYPIRFDPYKIVDHFGGIAGAVTALSMIGMSVKPKMLQKQRERGNMPADMIACLVLASVRSGNPINLYECLLQRQEE